MKIHHYSTARVASGTYEMTQLDTMLPIARQSLVASCSAGKVEQLYRHELDMLR